MGIGVSKERYIIRKRVVGYVRFAEKSSWRRKRLRYEYNGLLLQIQRMFRIKVMRITEGTTGIAGFV
jgi:hypothetical protein